MDYPAHSQYQHQHYQEYQHNQYQQQPVYDPSQVQAFDPSYYSYNQPYEQHHHQQYPYYSSQDYSNSYPQQFHQEPASIHPPGVPLPSDQAPAAAIGLNRPAAAAVAALSQFTQFAGNADAAQRAMTGPHDPLWQASNDSYPPIEQSPFRGGGRRGGRPFRRGGRGHFGPHGPRPEGSAPPSRGRGRGQGGGRHFPPPGAASTIPNPSSAPAEGLAASKQPSGQASLPVPVQVPAAPFRPPSRMAWCELCRVDCNTPEILEQHKKGKRHKKNLQVHERLQKVNEVASGQQTAQMSSSEFKPRVSQSEKVEGPEEKQPPAENLPSQNVTGSDTREDEGQKDTVGSSEASGGESREPGKNKSVHVAAGHGLKRKMRGGRGGKYLRSSYGTRRPVESSKPKQVAPIMCELCNVRCDSQIVLQSHLTGKKHLANLKRLPAHQALLGGVGLQQVYPPNLNVPSTSLNPQVQQGMNDPQVLLAQLLTYVLTQAQAQGTVPTAGAAGGWVAAPPQGSVLDTHCQQMPQIHGSQLNLEAGNKDDVSAEDKAQPPSVIKDSDAPPTASSEAKHETETAELNGKEVSPLPSEKAVIPSENPGKGIEHSLCGTESNDAITVSKSEAVTCDEAAQLRSEASSSEASSEDEDPSEDPMSENEEPEEEPVSENREPNQ